MRRAVRIERELERIEIIARGTAARKREIERNDLVETDRCLPRRNVGKRELGSDRCRQRVEARNQRPGDFGRLVLDGEQVGTRFRLGG